MDLTKYYTCIDIYEIKVGIVARQFSRIYNRVIALDLRQNFVSAQYFEFKLMNFDQFLDMHWHWQVYGWNYYTSPFENL